jgi:hypothetical protein
LDPLTGRDVPENGNSAGGPLDLELVYLGSDAKTEMLYDGVLRHEIVADRNLAQLRS